jgi:hypothetical protein
VGAPAGRMAQVVRVPSKHKAVSSNSSAFKKIWQYWVIILARQVLYHLIHASNILCSGYFRDRVLLFAQAGLDCSPPILHLLLS